MKGEEEKRGIRELRGARGQQKLYNLCINNSPITSLVQAFPLNSGLVCPTIHLSSSLDRNKHPTVNTSKTELNFPYTLYISPEYPFFFQMLRSQNLGAFLSHHKSYTSRNPVASSSACIQNLNSFSCLYQVLSRCNPLLCFLNECHDLKCSSCLCLCPLQSILNEMLE